jgi:hypothetical protein
MNDFCGRNRQSRPKSFRLTPELNEERGGRLPAEPLQKTASCLPRQIRDLSRNSAVSVLTIDKLSAVTGVTVRRDDSQQVFSGLGTTVDAFHIKVLMRNSANPPSWLTR